MLEAVKTEIEKVPKGSLFNDFVDEYKRLKKDSTAYRENLKADLKN